MDDGTTGRSRPDPPPPVTSHPGSRLGVFRVRSIRLGRVSRSGALNLRTRRLPPRVSLYTWTDGVGGTVEPCGGEDKG